MFGIGWTELLVIALVLLIFVGPRELPALLRRLGKIVGELRSASRELRTQIELENQEMESPKQMVQKIRHDLVETWTAPYADLKDTDAELKRELREANSLAALAERSADDKEQTKSAEQIPVEEKSKLAPATDTKAVPGGESDREAEEDQ